MDGHIHSIHLTLSIKGRIVLEVHELPPSNHLQIIRALILNLHGSPHLVGSHGTGRSNRGLPGQLPAEPAAGAGHTDANVVGRNPEDGGQDSLREVTILVRHHELPDVPVDLARHCTLGFHVEVLLRPCLQRALGGQRRIHAGWSVLHCDAARDIRPRVAPPWRGCDGGGEVLRLAGVTQATSVLHVGDDVTLGVALLDLLGAGAGLRPGISHHHSQQYSNSRDGITSLKKQLLLQVVPAQHSPQIVHGRHIRRRHETTHSCHLESLGGVYCQELSVGSRGKHHLREESARSTVGGVRRLATGLNSRSQLRDVLGDRALFRVGTPTLRPG
mmetsp:Transcript_58275/g.155737  ORF Transcript_58275/g.155737 Transcript_58275/m.155737 type:complete len:330 (-) Transcript_58275:201-1190(-)